MQYAEYLLYSRHCIMYSTSTSLFNAQNNHRAVGIIFSFLTTQRGNSDSEIVRNFLPERDHTTGKVLIASTQVHLHGCFLHLPGSILQVMLLFPYLLVPTSKSSLLALLGIASINSSFSIF